MWAWSSMELEWWLWLPVSRPVPRPPWNLPVWTLVMLLLDSGWNVPRHQLRCWSQRNLVFVRCQPLVSNGNGLALLSLYLVLPPFPEARLASSKFYHCMHFPAPFLPVDLLTRGHSSESLGPFRQRITGGRPALPLPASHVLQKMKPCGNHSAIYTCTKSSYYIP